MKEKIKNDILAFQNQNLKESTKNLFNTLGYESERTTQINNSNYQGFKDAFFDAGTVFNEEKALIHDWKSVDIVFQLTCDEIKDFPKDTDRKDIDKEEIMSYLFLAIELTKSEYTRTQLAQISREINKVFSMPVLTLFKYGNLITFSVINRRLNKLDRTKDVLEKITMIKDISILKPHRAHLEILRELSTDNITANNFKELHQAWEKALDIQVLNNKFYTELSNWFFWATKEVRFPGYENQDDTYNEQNLIRLLTRLLFVWFIKEKGLIPEKLFNLKDLQSILKDDLEIKKNKDKVYLQHQSNYYKAILQNLFFATLNQELKKREFRKDGQNMGAHTLMRYKSYFINPDEFINLLDNTVPFMNGGLFECLDYMIDEKKGAKDVNKMVYIDGFSDRADNVLCLPDYLFFSEEETVDLSEQLNSKSESIKNTKVHGLINILNSYKFTITENTPIEEDIALDPELLGRVFENLLASYNPETKETARKQTGSFYTPREVVDFMVNESLHAYLKQALVNKAGMSADDAEVGLEFLLAYNEKEHLFEPEEVSILIQAIDECKILDLACGSGAFPMGILHKQVYILQKLDPKNKLWKERQIEKIKEMEDITLIDTLAKDVETAFENNELDYGRKLYLIENCIYGVDIQAIAIQISKLRFFISLIVDQKIDRTNKDNFGIKALPNLETKFVAANSLISIVKPDDEQTTIYEYYDSGETLKELKKIYHTLFSARSPETK
ncbi:MAG: hypothetical protein PHE19_02425, partial [Candidatus Cloacimonetes bacterium]|nr:hypothetical protein [Candidatus Cloacimonadota bacterium]